MPVESARRAGRRAPFSIALIAVLLAFVSACGTRGREEVPYSVLKQHISKGEVQEVRLSATELEAVPTTEALKAGAPPLWVATPIPNDSLVPLLESKSVVYGGMREDT